MERKLFFILVVVLVLSGCKKTASEESRTLYLAGAGHSACAEDANGYYFANDKKVYYLDEDLQSAIPLCNKADCNHGIDNISDTFYCNAWCGSGDITLFDENIYYVGMDAETCSIYKMKTDGSGSEKFVDLYSFVDDGDSLGMSNFIFNQGFCYFSFCSLEGAGKYNTRIYRVELKKNATTQIIYELSEEDSLIEASRLRVEDQYLLCVFVSGDVDYDFYTSIIDTDTGSALYTLDRVTEGYIMNDQVYYTLPGEGILKLSLADGQTSQVISFADEPIQPFLSIDENYIYLDWSRSGEPYFQGQELTPDRARIDIYTYEGKTVSEISTYFIEDSLYRALAASDSKYIFVGETYMPCDMYALSLNDIHKENPQWITIDLDQTLEQ